MSLVPNFAALTETEMILVVFGPITFLFLLIIAGICFAAKRGDELQAAWEHEHIEAYRLTGTVPVPDPLQVHYDLPAREPERTRS